ncbi:MAG: mechanosensitive ion channel family protein [Ignavibacteria bacterium]
MESIKKFFIEIRQYFDFTVIKIGETELTLWTLVYLFFLLFLLIFITGKIRRWVIYKLLSKSKTDLGVRIAVGTIIRYIILVIGFVIALQTVGIDLSTLTILAGALGVGIGFGLQNITNNFVSGIIILFERPIKVGDRIEVGEIRGDVVRISMRSTEVVTNDNISIIVPNSEFISSTVINWSHIDRNVRLNFPIGVSYKSDPEQVRKTLLQVADENPGVLKEPKSDVLIDEFGENSIYFNLRVWTREYINRPGVLKSQLYYEILKKFRQNNIEIPFPQRDIHIRSDYTKKD